MTQGIFFVSRAQVRRRPNFIPTPKKKKRKKQTESIPERHYLENGTSFCVLLNATANDAAHATVSMLRILVLVVVDPHMSSHLVQSMEVLATDLTGELTFNVVSLAMLGQVAGLAKLLSADFAR